MLSEWGHGSQVHEDGGQEISSVHRLEEDAGVAGGEGVSLRVASDQWATSLFDRAQKREGGRTLLTTPSVAVLGSLCRSDRQRGPGGAWDPQNPSRSARLFRLRGFSSEIRFLARNSDERLGNLHSAARRILGSWALRSLCGVRSAECAQNHNGVGRSRVESPESTHPCISSLRKMPHSVHREIMCVRR